MITKAHSFKHTAFQLAVLASLTADAVAQMPSRPPRVEDVATIDGIVAAFYDVISGPGGQPREWVRDSTLYIPDVHFLIVSEAGGPEALRRVDHAEYARSFEPVARRGFYEREIHRVAQQFGPIAHVFSTYEWRTTADGPVEGRGINSLQLYWDGSRWRIASAMWTDETATNPIPSEFLPRAR